MIPSAFPTSSWASADGWHTLRILKWNPRTQQRLEKSKQLRSLSSGIYSTPATLNDDKYWPISQKLPPLPSCPLTTTRLQLNSLFDFNGRLCSLMAQFAEPDDNRKSRWRLLLRKLSTLTQWIGTGVAPASTDRQSTWRRIRTNWCCTPRAAVYN